jgi:hypothetical protein
MQFCSVNSFLIGIKIMKVTYTIILKNMNTLNVIA